VITFLLLFSQHWVRQMISKSKPQSRFNRNMHNNLFTSTFFLFFSLVFLFLKEQKLRFLYDGMHIERDDFHL
jgi:hypothetical protein